MTVRSIQIKDNMQVNGAYIFVWSMHLRNNGDITLKTGGGECVYIQRNGKDLGNCQIGNTNRGHFA